MNLSDYRKSYEKYELSDHNLPEEPIALFKAWFAEAEAAGAADEVNAMTVATVGQDGFPKSRIVLLKQLADEGFIFFTNYNSEKGKAIDANPNTCLSFFWPGLERQVIIKGVAKKASDVISDEYFQSRPEGSRIGAIVSPQSQVIPSREFLEEHLKELTNHYRENAIERPEHWGGYIVKPVEIEFWQGRANRLHDRIRYRLHEGGTWKKDRLAP